ncbi:MAG: hypothetical protein ACJAS1_005534 [Oleiphilaceae bacterium]|jgi:hypothetical protein
MKCPYCDHKIGLLSKTLNKFGKGKVCPSCSNKMKLSVNYKQVGLLILPVFAIHLFLLKPMVIAAGYSGTGLAGLVGGLLIVFSMRLNKVE